MSTPDWFPSCIQIMKQVLQPIQSIGRELENHHALFHTDCAQSIGKVPVDVNDGVDLLSIAGHKLTPERGGACMWHLSEALCGGAGHRPSTGNRKCSYIAGLGKTCEMARVHLNESVGASEASGMNSGKDFGHVF